MASEPGRDRLPFEPKKQQKPAKPKTKPTAATVKKSEDTSKPTGKPPYTRDEMAVPKPVSDRMVRRMAVLCGIPTALGMLTFIVSYQIVVHGWFKLPNTAVVLVSMGCFGLGVLGLTYGILSTSWDVEAAGSIVGWQEFKLNWGRMLEAWRETRQKNT